MEKSSSPRNVENASTGARAFRSLVALPSKICSKVATFAKTAKKIGEDDPRRLVHATKVGTAITLVSLFYYLHPLYVSFGASAMWAALTVVVVFEDSVGATLGKGINRMVATCLAGGLGVGTHHLAEQFGRTGKPIVLMLIGFIVAVILTFMRFFPKLKARYDDGLVIFILIFGLVVMTAYGEDKVFVIALKRMSPEIIGCCIAILGCILICPVWNGSELNNLVASNIDKLGCFLEGFGDEYFNSSNSTMADDNKSSLVKYKSVLESKNNNEIMANLARWEPGHGKFRFRHPWKQFLKIGTLTRQCAYKIDALSSCLNSYSQMKPEIRDHFKETSMRLSSEAGKALKQLSHDVKNMKSTLSVKSYLDESKSAVEDLKSLLKSTGFSQGYSLLDLLPMAVVTSLLIEIVACIEQIAEAVHELGTLARFKAVDEEDLAESDSKADHVVVGLDGVQDGVSEEEDEALTAVRNHKSLKVSRLCLSPIKLPV